MYTQDVRMIQKIRIRHQQKVLKLSTLHTSIRIGVCVEYQNTSLFVKCVYNLTISLIDIFKREKKNRYRIRLIWCCFIWTAYVQADSMWYFDLQNYRINSLRCIDDKGLCNNVWICQFGWVFKHIDAQTWNIDAHKNIDSKAQFS